MSSGAHNRLTAYVLAAIIIGVTVGHLCHELAASSKIAEQIAGYFALVTQLFLRLIKMIVAPLVLATLVVGVANVGAGRALGRMSLRTMLWFLVAGIVSLALGLCVAQIVRPGNGFEPPASGADVAPGPPARVFDAATFIANIVPQSVVQSLAENEILQVVVFSLFAGVALGALGSRAAVLVRGADALAHMMLKITDYVMRTAPVAVFAATAGAVSTHGLTVLLVFGKLTASFYAALLVFWCLLGIAAYAVLGRSIGLVARAARQPVLLAFATASSEAAYPRLLESLRSIGIPKAIVGLVLPLGYSFNLDGSMMYCAFALTFIAQAYDVPIGIGQQMTMLLVLFVMSKGLAGVPRASLVVLAAAMPIFGLPEAGLVLLLGIDQFLDMGRTATNVLGNAIATAVIAKWERVNIAPVLENDDGPRPST